jgi:hypothetical protein
MPDCTFVRGVLIGLVLLGVVTFGVLSLRPGGLGNQLRNIARRFKLALLLGGVYMILAAAVRLLSPNELITDGAMVGAAVVLGVIFLVRAQDRPLERPRRSPVDRPAGRIVGRR